LTELRELLALPPERLRYTLDPATLPFESTAQVEPIVDPIGQERAASALQFGVEISDRGFNIFVAGAVGSGRRTTTRGYLEQVAAGRPAPDDWVYVHNFTDPYRPRAIRLPAGEGCRFAGRMNELVAAARVEIPRAFESEEYEKRKALVVGQIHQQQQVIYSRVQEEARGRGFAIEVTPSGIATVPISNGQPITAEAFEQLPQEARDDIERRGGEVRAQMDQALRQVRKLEKESAGRLRELDREVALFAIGHILEELEQEYHGYPKVLHFLKQIKDDIPERLDDFRGVKPDGQPPIPPEVQAALLEERLARYRVNVFVDNSATHGAPVVEEYSPTFYNLMGRIEYEARAGGMTTDFRQIKPGAIHLANGGYLMLEAADLMANPLVWESLKKALTTKEARIENLTEHVSPVPAATLRPEPIPLSTKVVLVGSSMAYYVLYSQDEDFRKLFKVKADFAHDMERSEQNVLGYAAFIARLVRERDLRHFHRSGVARVVEHGARMVEEQGRLTTQFSEVADLVSESCFWADKNGHELVTAEDVDQAAGHKEYRSGLPADQTRRLIQDGTIMIDVDGRAEGQVNGLSVAQLGDFAFGTPSRITARTSPGNRGVLNIEREIALSGPIHSKGVLILAGYLSGKYALEHPLALSATLTFEQMYGEVEGDSASSAELYALLSSLSGLPINQAVAVTGSVNQYGRVQAVGGVTTKVEGFFQVCKEKGFTGEQGAIIPRANVKNLMLKDEVVQAVRDGRFRLWSVESVDQGIELLTGAPAGERGPDGRFPDGTVHALVGSRLDAYATRVRDFSLGGLLAGQQEPDARGS
jgi:predicted ATP-dependent protease